MFVRFFFTATRKKKGYLNFVFIFILSNNIICARFLDSVGTTDLKVGNVAV